MRRRGLALALFLSLFVSLDTSGRLYSAFSTPSPSASSANEDQPLRSLIIKENFKPKADSEAFCSGNGVRLPNSTCVCDSFYSGDDCSLMECEGGISANGFCSCPPGRQSQHCQPRTCASSIASNVDVTRRSFVTVLSLKSSMARDLNAIIPELSTVVTELNRTGVYHNYQLLTYLSFDGLVYLEDHFFETAKEFIDALEEVAISKGDDFQPMLAAIFAALNASPLLHPKSPIAIFADSLPSDASPWDPSETNQTVELKIIEQTIAWAHRLFVVLSETDKTPLDTSLAGFKSLDKIVSSTHGDLIHTWKTDVGMIVREVMAFLHNNENLLYVPAYECGQTVDLQVLVDDDVAAYYIFLRGRALVWVKEPSDSADPHRIEPTVSAVGFQLYTIKATMSSLKVIGPPDLGYCEFRIAVQSKRTILHAFSTDARIDVGLSRSVQGLLHHVSLLPLGGHDPSEISLDVLDLYDGPKETAVNVTSRGGDCAFPLQATLSTYCDAGPYSIYVVAKSIDGSLQYTRFLPAICELPAKRTPPAFVCLHGGTHRVYEDGSEGCDCMRLFAGEHCEASIEDIF